MGHVLLYFDDSTLKEALVTHCSLTDKEADSQLLYGSLEFRGNPFPTQISKTKPSPFPSLNRECNCLEENLNTLKYSCVHLLIHFLIHVSVQ